jgi:hypothetical protein
VLPRECDNDNCDYETFVGDDGIARAQWAHVPECEGPVSIDPGIVKNPPPGSFLAFMLGQK